MTTARAFTAPCDRLADAGLYSTDSQLNSVTLAVSGTRIVVTVAADEGNEVLQPARPARAVFRPVLRTAPTGRRGAAIPSLQANRPPAPRHPLPPQHQIRTFHANRRPAARTLHADTTRIARRPPMLTPRNPTGHKTPLTRGA